MKSVFLTLLSLCAALPMWSTDTLYVARYKNDKACAISYTFDDGLSEHYSLVAPRLERLGFRGTFWIVGSKINKDAVHPKDTTRMAQSHLRELVERGHEVSNHGWAHRNHTRFPLEVIKEDIRKNDSALYAWTGVMPRTFCYPGNRKSEEGMRLAEEGRVGTRTHQRSLGSKRTSVDLERWVRQLIATNDWGVAMTHGITYGYDAFKNPQILWEHLDRVKAQEDKVWVATFREVISYIKERDALRLEVERKKNRLVITPLLSLDRQLFTEPLTIVLKDATLRGISVKQGRKKLAVEQRGDKFLFDIHPFGGEITIKTVSLPK